MTRASNDVDYTYKGQHFVLRFSSQNQLLMVVQNGAPVVIFLSAGPRAISADTQLVSLAESAAAAYKAGTPSQGSAGTVAPTAGLTVDGVISMASAGLSDDLIITKIQKTGQTFDLSSDDLVRLKKANVSDAVMKAMMNPGAPAQSPSVVPPPTQTASKPSAASSEGSGTGAMQSDSQTDSATSKKSNLGGFLAGLKQSVTQGVRQGVGGPSALGHQQNVIDRVGLKNILPQYDREKSVGVQYPHIAITVLKAPPTWAGMDGGNGAPYCFTLKAVVWSDEQHSRDVGPFDWCNPQDAAIKPSPRAEEGSAPAFFTPPEDMTGINRTEGPKPPSTIAPNDRATQDSEMAHGSRGSFDLNMDTLSKFSLMLYNVRYALGESFADADPRVWIVSIQ